MTSDIEVEDFLEHHGIKGQKWGIRHPELTKFGRGTGIAAKAFGRGSLITAKAVGRGTKKTAIFVHDHPRFSASVAAGATFAAFILGRKVHNNQVAKEFERNVAARLLNKKTKAEAFNQGMKITSDRVKQSTRVGLEWTKNRPFMLKDIQPFQTQQTRLNWQKLL